MVPANQAFESGIEHCRNSWTHAARLRMTGFTRLASGALQLEFVGLPGRSYALETSTNVLDWVVLRWIPANGDGEGSYEDSETKKTPARFYRFREP